MNEQIAKAQLDIANLEDERSELQRKAQRSNSQYGLGALGALIGVLLVIFTSWWWLGLLLLLAGALAVFTQGARKRRAEREIKRITEDIRNKRSEIAALLEQGS